MTSIRGREIWLLVLGTVLLSGCGKRVSLTFFNLTGDTIDVYVTTPKDGRKNVGLVPPMGDLRYDVTIPKKQLPAMCSWQTGGYSETFIVDTKDVYKEISVLPTGKPRMKDRDASLKDEFDREIHPVPAEPSGAP